ncbi:unnamed protein product [Symbiodinium sp. CCMP2592]|nr:unnamed protein product [Symbiodinium sp. CCMP2592]
MISWTSIQNRPSRALEDQRSLLQDPPNCCDRHELSDLLPDTDYEFHLRQRLLLLPDKCTGLSSAGASTTHVDLQWKPPQVLGNERTADRWQLQCEEVRSYEAQLSIAEEASPSEKRSRSLSKSRSSAVVDLPVSRTDLCRRCRWEMGGSNLRSQSSEHLTGRLGGLRPDTLYSLEMFCAVNSMGAGTAARELQFWTMPLNPIIDSIRVRQGLVVLTLGEVGGGNVREFAWDSAEQRAFLRLLLDKKELLLTRYDLKVQVVGIATRSRGVVADPKGLDLRACLAASSLPGLGVAELEDAEALLAYLDGQCDAVLEAINASHSDGEPALTLLQSALSMSLPAHAITASKPPVAFGYRRLRRSTARVNNCK